MDKNVIAFDIILDLAWEIPNFLCFMREGRGNIEHITLSICEANGMSTDDQIQLKYLEGSDNLMDTLAELKYLKTLHLTVKQVLEKPILNLYSQLGRLYQLQKLDISYSKIDIDDKNIHKELAKSLSLIKNLTSLKLNFSFGYFDSGDEEKKYLKNGRNRKLFYQLEMEEIFHVIKDMTQLQELYLDKGRDMHYVSEDVQNILIKNLSYLTNLQVLTLRALDEDIGEDSLNMLVNSIGKLTKLRKFRSILCGSKLTRSSWLKFFQSLKKVTELEELSLFTNYDGKDGSIAKEVGQILSELKFLQKVDIHNYLGKKQSFFVESKLMVQQDFAKMLKGVNAKVERGPF